VKLTIISGGQTGSDQGALRAARSRGIPTGGYAPRGFRTEAGPTPELGTVYGLVEMPTDDYPLRTKANVGVVDAVLWIGNPRSPGGKLTTREANHLGKPLFVAESGVGACPQAVVDWLRRLRSGDVRLMVAGNRESSNPGIGAEAEAFVGEMIDLLRATESTALR